LSEQRPFPPREDIGQQLIRLNMVTSVQLNAADAQARQVGKTAVDVLLAQGVISQDDLVKARGALDQARAASRVAAQQGAPGQPGSPGAPAQPGGASAGQPPLSRSSVPVVAPPSSGRTTTPVAVPGRRASELLAGVQTSNRSSDNDSIDDSGSAQPLVVQFVNRILADAITKGASDIHFEPRRDKLDIRYRIDGTLHYVDTIRQEYQAACVSRIKIMADMNISERRLPQDGRISVTINNRSVDMRVSSLPTQYGESVVMRVLDRGAMRPSLEKLGFSDRNLKQMRSLIRKPHGIFLATGPTGSGKTTTIYSAIQEILSPEVNIITVEDPIEYDLEGIRQSAVHDKAGLTFAKQLRAILRQDPDIIYVGEIRDAETAEIAFRAALTGHLVFSTLHCNDSAGAITRLLNMGMDPFLVASSIVGVLAQRLVRQVCPTCVQPYTPTPDELKAFAVDLNGPGIKNPNFRMGAGCELCDNTGYRGRYSVHELLVMDDSIRNMVLQRTPSNKIREAAVQHGMSSMRQDAATKVIQGITTFAEAQKRVFIEDDYVDLAPVY
jgi:type IV pilus assembly protein PilB